MVGKVLADKMQFKGPSLFVDGASSTYIVDEDEDLILEHFPEAEIVTIKDAGHWVHAEQPKRFFDEVLRFCISLDKKIENKSLANAGFLYCCKWSCFYCSVL